MGLVAFSLKRLPPFSRIEETVFEIPASRPLKLINRQIRIIFILGGAAQLRLEDQALVPLAPGDAFVLSKPIPYAYVSAAAGKSTRLHALALSLQLEKESTSLGQQILTHFPKSKHYAGIQNASMLHYINLLRNEVEQQASGSALAVSALASLLVLLFIRGRKHVSPTSRVTRSASYRIEQAREYIHKNFHDAISLEQIAWHIGLSEEYLSRLFKRETGHTVFEYVRDVRLSAAKRLLIETNHPVTRISTMTGFSSPPVFCRVFRQAFTNSPMAYRSNHAGIIDQRMSDAKRHIRKVNIRQ